MHQWFHGHQLCHPCQGVHEVRQVPKKRDIHKLKMIKKLEARQQCHMFNAKTYVFTVSLLVGEKATQHPTGCFYSDTLTYSGSSGSVGSSRSTITRRSLRGEEKRY